MKTIYLIRHAKSDTNFSGQDDKDRSLNEQGYRDAHRMGKMLFDKKHFPELMISSPAIRAVSTALILAGELGYPVGRLELDESLYEMGFEKYIERIQATDDSYKSIALFGHNPIISQAAFYLSSNDPIEMEAGSVLVFEADITGWAFLGQGNAVLFLVLAPTAR